MQLELVDHGRGLSPEALERDAGVGIPCMRERARQLGGRLTIASGETGTTLHLLLPLHTQQLDTPV
jgi:signal transduction histidine kinase